MKDFADRSKATAKPKRRELVDLPSIIPMNERKWIEREDDGAVQFWRIKEFSSESVLTNTLLVGRSLESMLGRRRRSKKEISVLH